MDDTDMWYHNAGLAWLVPVCRRLKAFINTGLYTPHAGVEGGWGEKIYSIYMELMTRKKNIYTKEGRKVIVNYLIIRRAITTIHKLPTATKSFRWYPDKKVVKPWGCWFSNIAHFRCKRGSWNLRRNVKMMHTDRGHSKSYWK